MHTTKLFSVIAVAALFAIATPALAGTADFTNYFSFDDGGGRSVGDTGGQNGAMYGTSPGFGWAGGKSGTALGMDGTPQTGVALPNGMLTGSQGSFSVWFKMDELSDRNVIFSGKSTADNNVFVALSVDYDGRPQLLFRTDPSSSNRKVQIGAVLNKNEWYHLVFVATGQYYKAYVNGEEKIISGENIGRWFPDFTNQALSYRIGASEANPLIGSWNGMLDEMRIYNRALSFEEAAVLYQEGNAGVPTVPIALRPTLNFSISSDRVTAPGTVTLTWTTERVEGCTAGGNWSDVVPTSGTFVKTNLTVDQLYTLTCAGKGGSVDASVRVSVGTGTAPVMGGMLTVSDITAPSNPAQVMQGVSQYARDLSLGVRGDDVKNLQLHLISLGMLSPQLSSGYFGDMTKQALMKLQVKLGLPATGFFGPMTRAKLVDAAGQGGTAPSVVLPGTSTGTPPAGGDKHAQIAQLLNLITELQKQLAALKSSAQ